MKKILKVIVGIFIVFIAIGIFSGKSTDEGNSGQKGKEVTIVEIGKPLTTKRFEVTVNKVSFQDRVNTGNQFASLPKKDGVKYLVMDVTFKNVDNESRTLLDGEVIVNLDGKTFKYDRSETIMLEGWGLLLDSVNPMMSKKTKLVYALPSELKNADLFYVPHLSPKNTMINLGHID
ncbi:DUF4352 domain-containing protein [Fusobacterium ulcerans]|uniref:DUF4352 domain-containing protein n=1 Tax=Fusobacterium ulcerans TaxID=861 RepID=UPI001D09D0CC|nr:DUF4352 domain-containing protein [Fusobacterium ulcerans]MCB8563716.1 DUF4352 domain-containing protein [Fusobacterium ulcerans]MCB8649689.1 DUF4352 domain-containing protein [Fusobacterium ulcerans]